jgi:hypothetical protein
MVGDELDEPPRPAQRGVDPRLVRRRNLLHQHRIVRTDADRLNSAKLSIRRIRATAVFAGSAARSTPTVSTCRPYDRQPSPSRTSAYEAALPCGQTKRRRWALARPAGRMEAMSNSTPYRHPVTVTHLPVVRCAVCRRTVAHQPGQASVVLTKHYEKAHPEMVGGD